MAKFFTENNVFCINLYMDGISALNCVHIIDSIRMFLYRSTFQEQTDTVEESKSKDSVVVDISETGSSDVSLKDKSSELSSSLASLIKEPSFPIETEEELRSGLLRKISEHKEGKEVSFFLFYNIVLPRSLIFHLTLFGLSF